MSFQNRKTTENRFGFTVVELLIVIGILIVLGAILVPTVRLLNADRRIRESARMVNMFASSVRDAAVVDGEAAFMLVRNGNEPDRCYELRRMRILPPYAGNTFGDDTQVVDYLDMTTNNTYFYVDISMPFGDPTLTGINVGDSIKFNFRNVSYRIADIDDANLMIGFGPQGTPGVIRLTLDYKVTPAQTTESITGTPPRPLAQPIPPLPVNPMDRIPFQVFRRPVPINSGRLEIPGNQFIDMSKSGPTNDLGLHSGGETFFSESLTYMPGDLNYAAGEGAVVVVFDNNGAIDRYYVRYNAPGEEAYFPSESIYLLVATDREDEVANFNNLYNNDNLWVSIGRSNGAVYTGEIAQPDPSTSPLQQINDSRAIARRRLEDLQ